MQPTEFPNAPEAVVAPPGRGRRLSPGDIVLYRSADYLTTPVLYFVVLFGPWAFGTTQHWSIWTLNIANYVLGLLLGLKLWARCVKGYDPGRWLPSGDTKGNGRPLAGLLRPGKLIISALAAATVLLLIGILISALNARATWNPGALSFDYHEPIPWLPQSLDGASTWFAFWNYLGLACFFWALRDWLLGKSDAEQRILRQASGGTATGAPSFPIPERLRRLLWILAINGALLAGEGIVQRLEGSGKLLFLVKPRVNPGAETQFGPWAYRSNAAQYFNLLWPVCVGFWWTLNRGVRTRRKNHHVLLICALLIAVSPLMSTSRGGALITLGIILLSSFFLFVSHLVLRANQQENAQRRRAFVLLALFFTLTVTVGALLGWKSLEPRLRQLEEGFTQREEMYDLARPMARDYPAFGTGPGTFASVFQLYRVNTQTYWPAQLHNDWLETRITFGYVGCALIAVAFLAVLARLYAPGGIHGGRRFVILTYMALTGCLLHARFDFPFQIHSVLTLFLTLCAVLSVLSRKPLTRFQFSS